MKYVTEYGTLETATHGFSSGGRYRTDTYTTKSTGERFAERVACDGPNDHTPVQNKSIGEGYNAKCHYCWLNHGHTEAAHVKAIG